MLPEDKLREQVNRMPQRLSVKDLEKVISYLESLVGQTWKEALENPIYDDEPITEEEKRSIDEAMESVKAGEGIPLEEFLKELGD